MVLGRPDNPTGRLEPAEVVAALARPGRVLVVDEAFADFLPGRRGRCTARRIPGLVCVRSLTKLWGLAGLRVGYLLAGPRPWCAAGGGPPAVAGELARAPGRRRCCAAPRTSDGSARDAVAAARAAPASTGSRSLPLRSGRPRPTSCCCARTRADLRERLLDHGHRGTPRRDVPGARRPLRPGRGAPGPGRPGRAGRRPCATVLPEGGRRPATARTPRPPVHRTLVLGGARSGKSRHAQQLLAHRPDVLYVAPGPVPDGSDADWAARVAAHQQRPAGHLDHPGDHRRRRRAGRRPRCRCSSTASPPGSRRRCRTPARGSRPTATPTGSSGSTWRSTAWWRPGGRSAVPVVAVSNEVGSGVVPGHPGRGAVPRRAGPAQPAARRRERRRPPGGGRARAATDGGTS